MPSSSLSRLILSLRELDTWIWASKTRGGMYRKTNGYRDVWKFMCSKCYRTSVFETAAQKGGHLLFFAKQKCFLRLPDFSPHLSDLIPFPIFAFLMKHFRFLWRVPTAVICISLYLCFISLVFIPRVSEQSE